jgi:hypothetical protein
MKFLLLFTAWATLLFLPTWAISHPYQTGLADLAGRLIAPGGVEFEDLELFYPIDLGIYAALCLASTWAVTRRRLTVIAIGLPVLVVVELLSLVWAMKPMMSLMMDPHATGTAIDQVLRFSNAIIRITGLVAAAAVWFALLGRERLSLAARAWLGP